MESMKGAEILDVYDSDNSENDHFVDDFFGEENAEYKRVFPTSIIELPAIYSATKKRKDYPL